MKIVDYFGLRITDCTIKELLDNSMDSLLKGKLIRIMSINLTALVKFNDEMERYAESFDHVTADGKGFVLVSRILGRKISNQIAICDLSEEAIRVGISLKKKILLLGADRATNASAVDIIRSRNNGYEGISGIDGYFNNIEFEVIKGNIKTLAPDIVLVGISSPKKERLINELAKNAVPCIYIACGGYIDILGMKTKRAPSIIRKAAFEWIYRFYQEPKRMFGPMIGNGLFALFVLVPRIFLWKYIFKSGLPLSKIVTGNYRRSSNKA